MKNLERYIIVILIFIAVGAIGTAVYFGVNNKQLKGQDKVNVSVQRENEDSVLKENDKRNAELFPKYITNYFDKTRPYYTDLSGSFYHANYYYDKVYTKDLSEEAKIQLVLNSLIVDSSCVGTNDYCTLSKNLYDDIFTNLFGIESNLKS